MLRLLLVTDDALLAGRDAAAVCHAAVRGGVTAVQLRLKHASDREYLVVARRLVAELAVPLFVNDRVDIALAAGAAGVHLGPEDLPPALARRALPAGFLIGASVGSADEATRGAAADYWGVGPVRTSATKADAGVPLGPDGLAALLAMGAGRPCVAIGGIRPLDAAELYRAGFAGVAVASGILAADDVEAAARQFVV